MNKKWIPIIVALISIIPIGAGGQATNWTFDFSTNISGDTISSGNTITNEGDIIIDIKEDIALVAICLMSPIPEEYIQACEDR